MKKIKHVALTVCTGLFLFGAAFTSNAETGNPFSDVKESDWYYQPAIYALENNIVVGKGEDQNGLTIFDPNKNVTRAEFVQMIYNGAGKPDTECSVSFDDVNGTEWYAGAISWATENHIVSGKGKSFAPNGAITRQEIAVVLKQYAENYLKRSTLGRDELNRFQDVDEISDWATEAIKWAVYNGVMAGKGSKVAPLSCATRGEAVTLINNFTNAFSGYLFDEEFTLTVGEEVSVQDGITFRLEELEYFEDFNAYRLDYVMTKEDIEYTGIIWLNEDGSNELYDNEIYNMHRIQFVSADLTHATVKIPPAPQKPAPMEISGSREDVYTTTDYEYIVGDKCILYLNRGVTVKGNIMEVIENIMNTIEEETGYEYYVDTDYARSYVVNLRELYYGADPWPGVDEFYDKVAIYVASDLNEDGEPIMSTADNCSVVLAEYDFDMETQGVYALAHELTHTVFLRNAVSLNGKMNEGLACYFGRKVALQFTDFPRLYDTKENYYGTFPYTLDASTAEELFTTNYDDYVADFKEYQYGFYFLTYLMENYDTQKLHVFLDAINGKMAYYYDSPDNATLIETLKDTYSPQIFRDFGEWYQENEERFMFVED